MTNYKTPGPKPGDKGWVGQYQCERVRTGLVREIPRGEFADHETAQERFTECANNGARYQLRVDQKPVCRVIRSFHVAGRKPEEVCPYLRSRTVDESIDGSNAYRYFTCAKQKHGQNPKGIWNFWGLLPT
ncbi:MAG TPA: hypothetical protein VJA47_01410 [archaeon]|nr:hypothetical protein [archaeon]